jgi:hypothetical protein
MRSRAARPLGALLLCLLWAACSHSPRRIFTERPFDPGGLDLSEVLVLLPPVEPLPREALLASLAGTDSADPGAAKAAWTRLLCESARNQAYSPAHIACGDSLLLTPYQVRDTLLPRGDGEELTLRRFLLPILPLAGGREPPGNFLLLPQGVKVMTIPDAGSESRFVSLDYVMVDRRDGRILAYGSANGAAKVPTRAPEHLHMYRDPGTGTLHFRRPAFAMKLGMQPRHAKRISDGIVDDMLYATPFQRKK